MSEKKYELKGDAICKLTNGKYLALDFDIKTDEKIVSKKVLHEVIEHLAQKALHKDWNTDTQIEAMDIQVHQDKD